MSKTEIKNGDKVYNAAKFVALAGEGANWLYFTVAMVAKKSGMSKQTCRKYLKIMAQHNMVRLIVGHELGTTQLYKWTETL